jgi:hypothetical protein
MSLEDRVDRLTQTLERMLDQGSFSGGSRSSGTGGGGGYQGGGNDNAGMLARGANNFVSSVGQMAQGNYNLTSAIGDVTKVMGIFGEAGKVVAGITSNVSGNLIQMNQNLMASSKFGMTFGQDLGLFTEELGKAGIGQQQWVQLLQNNSRYLSGSASTAQESAQLFLRQNQAMMQNEAVLRARITGIDFSEFQDQLIVNTNLLKFQAIGTERTQKVLQESVVNTTIEIDNMSRITGKSRQEIQKGLDQQTQSNTMRLARMAMSAEQLARYNTSLPKMEVYGKTFADLFTEMSGNRGNIVSREGGEIAAGLEQIAPGVTSLMRQLSTETNADTRRQLETRIQYELSRGAADEEKMQQFVARANSNDPASRRMVEILTQGEGMFGAGKEFYLKSGGSYEAFRTQQTELLEKSKGDRTNIGEKAGAGAQLSQLINAGEIATKAISAGLSQGLKDLNDKTGQQLMQNKLAADYLKILTIQKIGPDELKAKLAEAGYTGKDTTDKTQAPKGKEFEWNRDNPLPVTGTVRIDPTALPRQALGSKDVFGSWFGKDWGGGGLNIMDGKEAAVPQGKVPEFINDMIAQTPGLINGLQGSLRNTMSETNPMAAFERAMQQFTSSINIPSTVSPASSPTPVNGSIVETKTTSDLHTAIEKLNTKMDKLITAVEDSGNANVKAVKSRGNLIA